MDAAGCHAQIDGEFAAKLEGALDHLNSVGGQNRWTNPPPPRHSTVMKNGLLRLAKANSNPGWPSKYGRSKPVVMAMFSSENTPIEIGGRPSV